MNSVCIQLTYQRDNQKEYYLHDFEHDGTAEHVGVVRHCWWTDNCDKSFVDLCAHDVGITIEELSEDECYHFYHQLCEVKDQLVLSGRIDESELTIIGAW